MATNVEGLRHALDAAAEMQVRRFVFCSTVGTIGRAPDGPADEDSPHEWQHLGGPYIQVRVVSGAAHGKMPVYFGNAAMEVVGISDAARAFLLAAEKGRVGERYIVSERYMTWKELVTTARPPASSVGSPVTDAGCRAGRNR